ncbi:MAG TPA: hypothetical protein VN841_24985 [Bryobacteraceae bacterium]|nr:hypothetical protein [Bryobacteraceae bacterium]
MKAIMKVLSAISLAALLGAAAPNADVKREEQYSDRLRKAQREYIRIMEEFDHWCSSHGQRVGAKGAQGDLGCVAPPTQAATPAPAPGKPEERR